MFGDFTDKAKGVIGVNSTSDEQIAPNNDKLDHGTGQEWKNTKEVGSNVIHEIALSVGSHFGSIAYCVKHPDGKAIHHFNDVNTKIWDDSKAKGDATLEASKDFPGVDLDAEKSEGSAFAAAIDEFGDTNQPNETNEKEHEPTEKEDKSNHDDKSIIKKAIGSVKRRLSKTWESVFSDDETEKEKEVPSNDDLVGSGDDDTKFIIKGGLSDGKHTDIDDFEGANIPDDTDEIEDKSNHKSIIEKAIGSVKRRLSKTWESVFSDDETRKENEVPSNDDIVGCGADDKEFVTNGGLSDAKDTAIVECEYENIPRTLIWDY